MLTAAMTIAKARIIFFMFRSFHSVSMLANHSIDSPLRRELGGKDCVTSLDRRLPWRKRLPVSRWAGQYHPRQRVCSTASFVATCAFDHFLTRMVLTLSMLRRDVSPFVNSSASWLASNTDRKRTRL